MESKHRQRLKASFPEAMEFVDTRVLDLELLRELRGAVGPVLAEFGV